MDRSKQTIVQPKRSSWVNKSNSAEGAKNVNLVSVAYHFISLLIKFCKNTMVIFSNLQSTFTYNSTKFPLFIDVKLVLMPINLLLPYLKMSSSACGDLKKVNIGYYVIPAPDITLPHSPLPPS